MKRGWHVERVDWRDRYGHSHDLFGIFDALAWPSHWNTGRPIDHAEHATEAEVDHGWTPLYTYAIQFTSAPNRAARRKKLEASPMLPILKAAGWEPVVWAWRIKDGSPVLAEDWL